MLQWGNPVVGGSGTTLVRTAIQSPDFVHGATGWRLGRDGSLEAHDVVIPEGSGGTVVTFGPTAPTAPNTGDVWYNTNGGLKANVWSGSAWVPYQIGTGAIAPAAITPDRIASLTASLIGNTGGVLNSNPYLTGGDDTGYGVYNGTLSVVSGGSLPAGAPSTYAGLYTQTGQWGNPYQIVMLPGSADPYQIFVTVWVNSASATVWNKITPATNGVNGADIWKSHTVPVNTWVQISDVVTIPAGATSASVGPSLNSATSGSIYFWGMTVMPQVSGALIQAGTVTAAQLAAGIVYAGIVDGTLIEGAQFVAYGANGQILAYSGPPAANNMVASISGAGGTDGQGTAYPAGIGSRDASGNSVVLSNAMASFQAVAAPAMTIHADGLTKSLQFLGSPSAYLFDKSVIPAQPGTPSTPESWHPMTLVNGWINQGGTNVVGKYRLVASPPDSVEITGVINGGAATSPVFFTLPAGYRPASQQPACDTVSTGHAAGFLQCDTAGNLTVQAASTAAVWLFHGFVSLDA